MGNTVLDSTWPDSKTNTVLVGYKLLFVDEKCFENCTGIIRMAIKHVT